MKVKALILIFLFLFSTVLAQEKAVKDKWFSFDKFQHFFLSTHLTVFSYEIYHRSYHNTKESSRYFSSGLVLTLGIGKETWDSKKPKGKFSYKDLIADGLGIILGLSIANNLK
ncbi:MAG: hypothetical protein RBG1_1C00001G1243 [candidate division Zixibacteria bacterium RBG-1]|nr:MAG: hypothetical protein RBG1_1C00001G1243 [candidate division Zixibacteria bacterium RBG-1]OGC84245.1 MAG: hypothetical protein A2V73_05225 [candidate division Zixibacteria bacterium RBG_19FT_COMBO_42_43]